MTKEELQLLYKEKILPEIKSPYHFGIIDNPTHTIYAYNPICGDHFQLFLNGKGKRCSGVHFHGFGCAVSKSSTSFLLRHIEGKEWAEIKKVCDSFLNSLQGTTPDKNYTNEDEVLQILISMKNFDGRQDCISLSWKAMYDFLEEG